MSTIETSTSTTPTADDVVELETHANWRAADIGDVETWTLRLTDEHHAELDAALAHARTVTDEVLDVTADDFPLPTLAPLLHDLTGELVNGRGFARITELAVDRHVMTRAEGLVELALEGGHLWAVRAHLQRGHRDRSWLAQDTRVGPRWCRPSATTS